MFTRGSKIQKELVDLWSLRKFQLRAKDSLTLNKKYTRTNVLKYSFFHRITDQWNQLPLDIRVSDNVNIFKSRVRKFFSDF